MRLRNMGTIELRGLNSELRASNDGAGKRLMGYAATFGTETEIGGPISLGGGFRERLDSHCFDSCLAKNPDVRCLVNHDPNQVLGRTRSGTMKLSTDKVGLRYEVKLPDSSLGDNVYQSVKRGDVSGSSFGFTCLKDGWVGNTRTLLDLDLLDCGPVTYPAYQNTSVSVRSASGATTMVQLGWYKAQGLRLPLTEAEIRSKMRQLRQEMMGDDDADDQERECSCPCDSCSRDNNCLDCDCMEGCAGTDCASSDGDGETCHCTEKREVQGKMKRPTGRTLYAVDRELLQKERALEQELFDARAMMKRWR